MKAFKYGTKAAMPSAPALVGKTYHATDVDVYFKSDGHQWFQAVDFDKSVYLGKGGEPFFWPEILNKLATYP